MADGDHHPEWEGHRQTPAGYQMARLVTKMEGLEQSVSGLRSDLRERIDGLRTDTDKRMEDLQRQIWGKADKRIETWVYAGIGIFVVALVTAAANFVIKGGLSP